MTRTANLSIAFSDEQAMILDAAKDFCRDKSDNTAVRALLSSDTGFNPDIWKDMIALGWTGLALPEHFGGFQMGIGATVPLVESMGKYMLCTPFISATIVAQAILRGGSKTQQAEWLPAMAKGCIGSLALLDNEDWGAVTTSCTLTQTNDGLILNGKKLLVNDATVADFFLVLADFNGTPVLVRVEANQLAEGAVKIKTLVDETKKTEEFDNLDSTSQKIINILEEYVKPAVAADGGNIAFESFDEENKVVKVILQGACSGCPSSTFTLKSGIEGLLKSMLNDDTIVVEAANA